MSCDIHIHAEVKIKGRWHHYDQPECVQDYRLFARMAGVRGAKANAMVPPRGLPINASFMTRFDATRMGGDGHSHSWLTAAELERLRGWCEAFGIDTGWDQWLFGNSYSGFARYPDDRPQGLQDVRFVFWFDN